MTKTARWSKVQRLFDRLVDLPIAEQQRRLDAATDAADIVAEVRAMLSSVMDAGILDGGQPGLGADDAAPPRSSLAQGDAVGAFTIERLIGRGGMGEVYLGHRTAGGFEQRVALKLLRVEAAEREALFERERQLLARLDHPGLARLIDGGVAPDGRPFMAIEYIDGEPIDAWCRRNRADLATRLRLFLEICDAVAYAHGNLVVHRDIKPSNILVDQAGHARLLDFGIAKLLDDVAGAPATTIAMLTPEFAAPEQLAGDRPTVGTDVYALGALLYDLLVGAGPWRRESSPVSALVQRMLHEDPPAPSKAAAARDDAPIPPQKIAGDLDAIVLKAMRREAADRYRTVDELAGDVERHRAHEPVRARAGSRWYAARRFMRRNRLALAAATAVFLALLAGAGGIAWQARQTAIERDVALAEARRSEAISGMLTLMFRDAGDLGTGAEATVKQLLDQTSRRMIETVAPGPRSTLLVTTIADLYVYVEDPASADALLRRALDRNVDGGDPVSRAEIQLRLASTAAAMDRTNEIGPLIDAADRVFSADPGRFRLELQEVTGVRAQLARRQGDYDRAIGLLTASLPGAEEVYVENHRELLNRYNSVLVYMLEANRLGDMPPVFARAEAAIARGGQPSSMPALAIRQQRGVWHLRRGETAQAEAVFERVATLRRAAFGRSTGLAVDLLQLARVKLQRGKPAEARRLLEEALPLARERLGGTAVPTIVMAMSLAEALAETGDTAAAERRLAEAAPIANANGGNGPMGGIYARTRAIIRLNQGRRADALADLNRAETIFRALGPAGETHLRGVASVRARLR
jgi:non-specific serine/threonine protein kinase/serine/threonine-protein kinase